MTVCAIADKPVVLSYMAEREGRFQCPSVKCVFENQEGAGTPSGAARTTRVARGGNSTLLPVSPFRGDVVGVAALVQAS
jgi:hypothetical protein